jgi:hypothetical protein
MEVGVVFAVHIVRQLMVQDFLHAEQYTHIHTHACIHTCKYNKVNAYMSKGALGNPKFTEEAVDSSVHSLLPEILPKTLQIVSAEPEQNFLTLVFVQPH